VVCTYASPVDALLPLDDGAGDGMFGMRNGDRFHGVFREDRPAGAGVLAKLDGRRIVVEYNPNDSLLNDLVPIPVCSSPGSEHVIEQVIRVLCGAGSE